MLDELPLANRSTTALLEEPLVADDLLPLVYDELRTLAARYLAEERAGHTLQPTALVHEAYLRLSHLDRMDWRGRAHFFATAAQTLRRVLVDHARVRAAATRGDGRVPAGLDGLAEIDCTCEADLLVLDVALEKLARVSPRQARLVEIRFFAGLSLPEAARVLGIGVDRIKADWRFVRAWLEREIRRERDER